MAAGAPAAPVVLTRTGRSFARLEFVDRYGASCSLQKSSLATEPAIWLGVNDAAPKILAKDAAAHGIDPGDGTGWVSYPVPAGVLMTTRMHLTREQVAELLPHLQRFVDTGELGEARAAMSSTSVLPGDPGSYTSRHPEDVEQGDFGG